MKNILMLVLVMFSFEIQATDAMNKKQKIERVIDLSGIRTQTLNAAENMKNQQIPMDPSLPKEVADGLRKILTGHYDAGLIIERFEKTLDWKFSEKKIDELLAFYNLPEIVKVSELEMKGSSVEAEKSKLDYAKELMVTPPKKERIAILEDHNKKFKMIDFFVDLSASALETISSVNGHSWDSKQREDVRRMLAPQYEQIILHAQLFTYRSLSDDEIKNYVAANYNNKYVLRLNSAYMEEVKKYNQEWSKETGTKLKKYGEEVRAKYKKK